MTVKNYSAIFEEDPLSLRINTEGSPESSTFNSQARSDTDIKLNNFVDTTDQLANEGLVISFASAIVVPELGGRGVRDVQFKAFITAYNETFSSDYVSEQVFGRIDPIHTFKQTTRSATLSFVIPCSTPSESFTMLNRVDKLRSYLYPTYTDVSNALTIDQNPLVRIKIMNLITNNTTHNSYDSAFGSGHFLAPNSAVDDGVLAAINNMNVNFNLESESGVFEAGGQPSSAGTGTPAKGIYPKLIEISIDFSIIHERNLGDGSGVYGTPNALDGGIDYQAAAARRIQEALATQEDEARAEEEQRPAAQQAVRDGRIASFRNALAGRRMVYQQNRDADQGVIRSLNAASVADVSGYRRLSGETPGNESADADSTRIVDRLLGPFTE